MYNYDYTLFFIAEDKDGDTSITIIIAPIIVGFAVLVVIIVIIIVIVVWKIQRSHTRVKPI